MGVAAAEQKKLIDQLMGREISASRNRFGPSHPRDGNRAGFNRNNDIGFYSPRVCKSYLVGECPHDLFQGTKLSMGRCPQIHLARYKIDYEKAKREGKNLIEFEKEYYMILLQLLRECDEQVKASLNSLKYTSEDLEKINQATKELDEVDTKLSLMNQEINALLEVNEVEKAMIQTEKLQDLQIKRKEIAKRVKKIAENVNQSAQQKLQVCEICGAYLSRLDTDRRLADHFLGKTHLAYVKMRQELEILKSKKLFST